MFKKKTKDRQTKDRSNFYTVGKLGKTREITPEGYLLCRDVPLACTGSLLYGEGEVPVTADAGLIVITRGDDAAFYITGKRIERLVAMTNLDDDQSLRRFQRIWRFMELDAKLKEKGCKDGDEVVIGDQRFTFQE